MFYNGIHTFVAAIKNEYDVNLKACSDTAYINIDSRFKSIIENR